MAERPQGRIDGFQIGIRVGTILNFDPTDEAPKLPKTPRGFELDFPRDDVMLEGIRYRGVARRYTVNGLAVAAFTIYDANIRSVWQQPKAPQRILRRSYELEGVEGGEVVLLRSEVHDRLLPQTYPDESSEVPQHASVREYDLYVSRGKITRPGQDLSLEEHQRLRGVFNIR